MISLIFLYLLKFKAILSRSRFFAVENSNENVSFHLDTLDYLLRCLNLAPKSKKEREGESLPLLQI